MDQTKPKSASEHNHNRACDACRLHKVRCLPNSSSSKICQRCAKTDRECIFTAPQKRKQKKRTDTRVAELEREVQAMRALFDGGRQGAAAAGGISSSEMAGTAGSSLGVSATTDEKEKDQAEGLNFDLLSCDAFMSSTMAGSMASKSTPQDGQSASTGARSSFSPDQDIVDRGVITMSQAEELYQIYNSHLVQHYPAVFFQPDSTAEDLRRTKPTLFLAVIAAASGKIDPHLYSILNSEVLQAYAYRIVVSSEKSLELVQAMIITSVWYFSPGKFSQLKFYELIHMAVTMAFDIGLGTNPQTSRTRRAGAIPPEKLNDEDVEKRRVFLVCYLVSIGTAMSMRRPNMLRYNSWVEECLNSIATNENPHAHDKTLIQWVKILKITEELHSAFSFDDIGNIANLSENRVQIMVNGFEKRLDAWKRDAKADTPDALLMAYHFTQVQLHELGLHDDHPPEDFRPPYKVDKLISIQVIPEATSSHIDTISVGISNAHSLLDILLRMDVEEIRALPIYNFVRVAVGIAMLLKLYISTKSPQSKIGAALEPRDIKLEFYLTSLIQKLHEAVGSAEFRAPLIFLGLFIRLANWYNGQENDAVFTAPATLEAPSDECWSPRVQVVSAKQALGGMNQEMPTLESKSAGHMNRLSQTGGSHLDVGAIELVEDFLPYELMDFVDAGFDDWMENPIQGMMLPGLDGESHNMHAYDWDASIPSNNGL